MEPKQTIGQIITDLQSKPQDIMEVGDIQALEEARYIKELHKAITLGKQEFKGDFYVEVMLKKEKLYTNMMPRIFAIPRETCPTPFYGQDCYKYKRSAGDVAYLWSVPNPDICDYLEKYANELEGPDKDLYQFVLQHHDGTLLRLANELNGEEPMTLNLIKPKRIIT